MNVSIETQRLRIRDMIPSDCDFFRENMRDEEVMRYLMIWFETDAQLDHFVKHQISLAGSDRRQEYFLSIETLGSKKLVGTAIIVFDNDSTSTAEIGYVLSKTEWGRGYATETARALIKFCFQTLKMHRVYGKCDELNSPSARVLQKCGMTYEGTLREHIWLQDHWRSSQIFGILDREFSENRPAGL